MKLDACEVAPSDWNRLAIKDVCQRITSGGTPSRRNPEFFENGSVPWVKTKELSDGFLWATEEMITEEAVAKSSAKRLPPDTILLAMYGATVGMLGILGREMTCNQASCAMLVKPGFDRDFLFYQLLAHRGQLQGLATGAAQQNLSGQQIKECLLPFPPELEQRRIGAFLRTLDDRIALLRETNATLEAIAQALFKSWFVDFDPVHARTRGEQPEGLPEPLAALFPDSFEESPLGLVPRGWRVGSLNDVAIYQNGYAFKTKDWQESGHPVVKIGNVKPGIIDVSGCSYVAPEVVVGLDRFRLGRGDLLVGMTGYVGETGLVPEIEPAAYLNQRVGRISTSDGIKNLGFVYCLVRNPAYKVYAESKGHGSAQANVSGADLMAYRATIPSPDVLDAFNARLHPLIEKILSDHDQAQTLATLRDTLLPRLISGALRLPEAEALAEVML